LFLWWLKAAVMCMSQVIDMAGCGRHLCIRRSAAAANHHAFKRVDAQLVAAEWADWYSLFWLRESSGNWGHCLEVSVPFLEVGEERCESWRRKRKRFGCHLQALHLILLAIFWVLITPPVTPGCRLDLKNTAFFEMVLR
jgi:hypothetical protein